MFNKYFRLEISVAAGPLFDEESVMRTSRFLGHI
jgi:hypothetical protein